MNLKRLYLIFLCFFVFAFLFLKFVRFFSDRTEPSSSYLISVPIVKYSSINTPCIDVNIEDQTICSEIDLGFRGDFSLPPDTVEHITDKSYVNERFVYNFRGSEFKEIIYRVPKFNVGDMEFNNYYTHNSNSLEFLKESMIILPEDDDFGREKGRLGWGAFARTNLFIDCKNDKIAFADSIDTLISRGFMSSSYVEASFAMERGLLEVDVIVFDKKMRLIFDTGSTWNALHQNTEEEFSVHSMGKEESPAFKIEGYDFGPTSFRFLPIKLPIKIDGLIGIEFFNEHAVFFDFSNGKVYVSINP